MITNQLVTDLSALVAREAQSALPDAPIRTDHDRPPRTSLLAATRLRLTNALRWAADLLEPATPQAKTFPSREGGNC